MKKRNILQAAVFGLLLSTSGALADDITFAVAGPMTGQLANIGDQFKQGAQAAADAINAAGGINGKQIKLSMEDDQCDPKQAVSIANRIVANGIKFVDGHACSGSSIPASAVYAEGGVMMMSPASSNPVMTDDAAAKGWTTIMRLYTRDDAQGAFIVPTTSPVQFEPEALHASIDRLMAQAPEAMYLTHYGRVRDTARLAADLHVQIDAMTAIARACDGRADRHRALVAALGELCLERARAHGCRLDAAGVLRVLGMDIELNAQGLECWLDRGRT